MRVACLYLPGFLLQVHARASPKLVGASFAVLLEGHGRIHRIAAVSRGARDAGVRLGMTATQARAAAADVLLVDGDPAAYDEAMRALGEAALAHATTVDIRRQGVLYARVPGRGGAAGEGPFATRLLAAAAELGLSGRVAVAGGVFTAWAATQAVSHAIDARERSECAPSSAGSACQGRSSASVRLVPRGGDAAFLAPLGLELLPIDPDVRHTLTLLGVKTLGDFAALPAPSVGRRWARWGAAAQGLARGEDPSVLEPYVPREPVRETIDLDDDVTDLEPLVFVLRPLIDRACARLRGRGTAVAKAIVALKGRAPHPAGEAVVTEVPIAPARPTAVARTLVDLARAHLAERGLAHTARAVEVRVIEEAEALPQELSLPFGDTPPPPDPNAVDVAIARLRAVFGAESVSGVKLVDRHRPEGAYEKVPFVLEPSPGAEPRARKRGARSGTPPAAPKPTPPRLDSALRLIDPPTAVDPTDALEQKAIRVGGARHRIAHAAGPVRLQGEWWTAVPMDRDYWEVRTAGGGRFWLYRDHADGRLYLHGVFD